MQYGLGVLDNYIPKSTWIKRKIFIEDNLLLPVSVRPHQSTNAQRLDVQYQVTQDVALTGRNRTGPPCSVGRSTVHAPVGRPVRRQRYRRRQKTDASLSCTTLQLPFDCSAARRHWRRSCRISFQHSAINQNPQIFRYVIILFRLLLETVKRRTGHGPTHVHTWLHSPKSFC